MDASLCCYCSSSGGEQLFCSVWRVLRRYSYSPLTRLCSCCWVAACCLLVVAGGAAAARPCRAPPAPARTPPTSTGSQAAGRRARAAAHRGRAARQRMPASCHQLTIRASLVVRPARQYSRAPLRRPPPAYRRAPPLKAKAMICPNGRRWTPQRHIRPERARRAASSGRILTPRRALSARSLTAAAAPAPLLLRGAQPAAAAPAAPRCAAAACLLAFTGPTRRRSSPPWTACWRPR